MSMNEFIPSGVAIAIALIIYFFISSKSRKPLYEEKPVNITDVMKCRHESDVKGDTAYELACIEADQYIKDNPTAFPNGQYRGYSIHHARKRIVKNILARERPIVLAPK